MVLLSDIAQSFSFIQHEGFVKVSDYYRAEEFGNAELVMAGPKFSLKFERDRGQVFVDIGNSDLGWEKLEYALIFVDESITEEQLGVPPQVARLAELAQSHWTRLTELYGDNANLLALREFCKIRSSALISGIFSKP